MQKSYRPGISDFVSPSSNRKCQHCRGEAVRGTRGGCGKCGKVQHTRDGKRRK